MTTSSTGIPVRAKVTSAPPIDSSPNPSPPSGGEGAIVRMSWNLKDRSPTERDLQEYLRQQHYLGSTNQVKMRLSRCSAFVACAREEDAKRIAGVKPAEVAGIKVRFSLVPRSSLDEDYSCSVLVFGVQLPEKGDQEARFVSLIKDAPDSPDVTLSRDSGDYDVLIISAEMALIFVDERKKDQLGSLAEIFNFSGVTNICAPHLKAFKLSRVPMKYQKNKQALCSEFAQWKPEIVLHEDTAVITIVDPSATTVMGDMRACCESVAGQSVSIEYPAGLRDELATRTLADVTVESLPPAQLAYFGAIRRDPNVSVYIDHDVLHITGPRHSCVQYKKWVKTSPLHTLDSTLDPEVVRFLSTAPAKERLTEMAKSCQCVCLESELSSYEPKLTIVSGSKADAIAYRDKLMRKYAVVTIPNLDCAILQNEAPGALESVKAVVEQENPGIQILLEGDTVKLVGERKDINSIDQRVKECIFELVKTDETVELSRDGFAVMEHSSKWREIKELGERLSCKIQERALVGSNLVTVRVCGMPDNNVQTILSRINQLKESLVAKVVRVNKPGIQKVCLSDSCLLSTPSPSCSTLITCVSMHLLRDVIPIVTGKISSQAADVLVNSTKGDLSLQYGQITKDLVAVAGPALARECARYVKDRGPVPIGGIAVTGAGKLQAQFVIHGNVMRYSSDCRQESIASLQSVVQKALEECDRRSLQSIAFPAIGIGYLSFSLDVAVETLVGSAVNYLTRNRSTTTIKKVILVGFEGRARDRFHIALEQRLGLHTTGATPERSKVHSTSGTVPDYSDLKLPTLRLDPPSRGTPPMGTPLEFSILAESSYHCSQAEAELQQNVDSLLRREEVADETIEQLPTSFVMAFLSSAEAAHVQVTISHNPAMVELCGLKADVDKAVDILNSALLMLTNYIKLIDREVSSELRTFTWHTQSEGLAKSLNPEECYELEKARRLQKETVTLDRGRSGLVTYNMETHVEVTTGATRPTNISRVQKGCPRPETWEGRDIAMEVKRNSQEFSQVAAEFQSSVMCKAIVKIQRIQNDRLWQAYQTQKLVVTQHTAAAERKLYHGCSSTNVDSINTNGFTARFAGSSNGMVHGQGIYFARDASYSAGDHYSTKDRKGHKRIYLCLVLTGVYKKGSSEMRVPPPLSPHTTKWCHSTVNSESNPTIFVIYENNMVYPQYIITFTMH